MAPLSKPRTSHRRTLRVLTLAAPAEDRRDGDRWSFRSVGGLNLCQYEAVTIVTVFRSRLRAGIDDEYGSVAVEMSRLVRLMNGFVDEKSYVAADGERVSVIRFVDVESHQAWAEHPDHRTAQRRGRDEFYAWFDISVSEERHSREWFNGEQ